MSNVLVTGCFGFVGHSLINYLKNQSIGVFGIGRAGDGTNVDPQLISGDISFSTLNEALNLMEEKPDVIYHLAGASSVYVSANEPYASFESSVMSSAILLEWVRNNCLKTKVVIISSAAVYGNTSDSYIEEHSMVNPFSNYGYHKKMVEDLASMYRSNHQLNITIVRIFSVYGNGLKKQILWDTCNKLNNLGSSKKLECFGTGKEQRDWIHIDDVVKSLSIVGSLKNEQCPSLLNLGSGNKCTVEHLLKLIVSNWFNSEKELELSFNNVSNPGDPYSLVSNNFNKNSICGKVSKSLEQGVFEYIQWYKNNV